MKRRQLHQLMALQAVIIRKRQKNTWISSDNCSDADEQPPPKKKGRPGNVECGNVCTPCVLWSDSGSAEKLHSYHTTKYIYFIFGLCFQH